ncbi:N-acetylmuramoyl-L-alanine amidase [Luteibacter aegosomaticola]|uniref:N-acetylmuramoyl-L-alanine amidase n=1 Tax=Luteibacter aegosomaticola TaxID=2911538 RepID=UPI001FFADDDD|nr:N-acetylmuramoyl-L-alanine amidase [Luteibacter aegosomaticola]UPG89540.1 N-acetylmuramoyl-L-alanine amidase [Luteibacter aegosomaticola]
MLRKLKDSLPKQAASLAIAVALLTSPCVRAEQVNPAERGEPAEFSQADIAAAVQEIERIANEVANKRSYFEQDYRPISFRVTFSPEERLLYFDTDERMGPEAGYTDMIDMTNNIETAAQDLIEPLVGNMGPVWRYGGRDSDWWMDRGLNRGGPASSYLPHSRGEASLRIDPASATGPVVLTGGHGFYYNHGQKRWTSQRDVVNGVLEDDITQLMANELESHLATKRIQVTNLRRLKAGSPHQESGQEWWRLGVRYHIESLYPDLRDVWNSSPNAKYATRERDEDLRSRPLYANHLKAKALLQIHTNANEDVSSTGARAYIHSGRPEDKKLASLVLCSMSEMIHSVDEFATYSVPAVPNFHDKHAETSFAKVPAVIVEVGFHTNPDDVKYLTNPLFKYKAMAGVAKGYRLYRDGRTCAPFKIASDQAADVVVWGRGKLPIAFGGNPDFPIKLITQKLDCPTCQPMHSSVWDAAAVERTRIEHACRPEDLAHSPIRYQVSAIDAYGVKSNSVTYTFNCKPRQAHKQRIRRHS